MQEDKIMIPREKMEETKNLCANELSSICAKDEVSPYKIVRSFLKEEFRNYVLLLLTGLFLTLIAGIWGNGTYITFSIMVYFVILGCVSIYEFCKNKLYGMDELLQVTRIRPYLAIVYKTICITFLETVSFLMLMLVLQDLITYNFYEMFSYTLLPILISQAISLALFNHKGNAAFDAIFAMGIYAVVSVVCYALRIADYISGFTLLWQLLGLMVIYIVLLKKIYVKDEGGTLIWN